MVLTDYSSTLCNPRLGHLFGFLLILVPAYTELIASSCRHRAQNCTDALMCLVELEVEIKDSNLYIQALLQCCVYCTTLSSPH